MAYLLDSDVFIQAKNLHYGFDFCPGFWEWIANAKQNGVVLSIDKIGNELTSGTDALADWAKSHDDLFRKPDAALLQAMGPVSEWVTSQSYDPSAVNTFFQVADYYLVAYALAHGHRVATHEVPASSPKKVKIPNVCIGVGVGYMSPFEMLRVERVRLVMQK